MVLTSILRSLEISSEYADMLASYHRKQAVINLSLDPQAAAKHAKQALHYTTEFIRSQERRQLLLLAPQTV